uniref:Uncharacterized protein n=1 Tax=Glossina austeni TaxID=7395 RepID=A0A1A9URH2_GLOAU
MFAVHHVAMYSITIAFCNGKKIRRFARIVAKACENMRKIYLTFDHNRTEERVTLINEFSSKLETFGIKIYELHALSETIVRNLEKATDDVSSKIATLNSLMANFD